MEIYKDYLKSKLDENEKYREMLFRRGYLFTDKEIVDLSVYPFYDIWNHSNVGKYHLYVQENKHITFSQMKI